MNTLERPHGIAALASLCLLGGCAATATSPLQEGPVRLGQSVRVDGPIVRPLELIEDSRCPYNARCIRAGRAIVRAEVSGGNWHETLDLTLGEPVQVADGKLTLVSVVPEREAGKTVDAADYRFAFIFAGGL